MVGRGRPLARGRRSAGRRTDDASSTLSPLIYTAQDVARFCEVDLKTIHHWADAGKIEHHRTEGRHLRFRRNHVLTFLRAHGYPLHPELTHVRPSVMVALPSIPFDGEALALLHDVFAVRQHDAALHAVARLVATEPDALVLSANDATLGSASLLALKNDPATSWITLVVVGEATGLPADRAIGETELPRLAEVLTELLAVAAEADA